MKQMNVGRIILGGVVAAVIINAIEWVMNGVVLKADWAAAMQSLNRPTDVSGFAVAVYNIIGLLEGIIGVWLYAAISRRYGSGPITRAKAGLVTWALVSLIPSLGMLASNLLPGHLMTMAVVVDFVAILLGVTMGAILYREEAAPIANAATA
jgi:hypothetical protein